MITTVIIAVSLALAAAFSLAWLLMPGLRRQIEDPKHWFQDRVQRYDQACHARREIGKPNIDEPK